MGITGRARATVTAIAFLLLRLGSTVALGEPPEKPERARPPQVSQPTEAPSSIKAGVPTYPADAEIVNFFYLVLEPGQTLSAALNLKDVNNEVTVGVSSFPFHFNSHFDRADGGARKCNAVCSFGDYTNSTTTGQTITAATNYKEGGPNTNKGWSMGWFRVAEKQFSPTTGKLVAVRLEIVYAVGGQPIPPRPEMRRVPQNLLLTIR